MPTTSEIRDLLERQSCVLWDFDGVLLDSMSVREEAFRHTLRTFDGGHVDTLVSFHKANGGWSRYVKYKYFQTDILGVDFDENQVAAWANEFSDFCMSQLTDPKRLIAPTVEMVTYLSGKVPMHIVSGSDGNELRQLCDKLGLKGHFVTIEGSPTPKTELVRAIMSEYGYDSGATWLIGDSMNDQEAAKANGLRFAGFGNLSLVAVSDSYWEDR